MASKRKALKVGRLEIHKTRARTLGICILSDLQEVA